MKPDLLGEVTDHGPISPRYVVPSFVHMIIMRTNVVVTNEFVENLSGTTIINLAILKYVAKWASGK